MSLFLLLSLLGAALLWVLDRYVYRHLKMLARYRGWAYPRLALAYRIAMPVMPLVLPAWGLAARLAPGALPTWLGPAMLVLWALYYVPKLALAGVIALKDVGRFASWLFAWFQQRLLPTRAQAALAGGGSVGLDLADMRTQSRSAFLRELGWTPRTIPFVVVGYELFSSLYDFRVHRVDVPLPGLPRALDGLTIAQLSDLHAGSFFSPRAMHDAVDEVNALGADVVAITGDYVNTRADELPAILPGLERLRAPLGVYGCLGNHDHYANVREVARGVRGAGVDLLVNEHRVLHVDGAELRLVGTDNTGFNQCFADLPRAVRGLAPGADAATVLLAHDPTFWDTHVRPAHPEVDLMLAGHTHGGQLGVELGPLRFGLARLAYRRWAGRYSEARADGTAQHLYVNRGLGTVGPPVRMGIRPEITLLTLRRA